MTLRLSAIDLRHSNGTLALRGLDLSIERGERVAIIGPSGAGKTTLLNLLASALPPSAGQLEVLGVNPWRLSSRQRQQLRSRIALIHQAPPLPARQRVGDCRVGGQAGAMGAWAKAC
ncbi:ATP-binding cassette domain-containing protein [Pseudomonas syringae pv. actinidiae]|nr:ATP-binding cassette domain-containing protein [Pseudomonas syringae pv. actinidiae]